MMVAIFILNFFIARYFTARLVQQKFIKKNSEEMKKATFMWFFPIVGALGLFMLLWTHKNIKFWKSFSKWLFLKHA
jgi:Na+/proline symporter